MTTARRPGLQTAGVSPCNCFQEEPSLEGKRTLISSPKRQVSDGDFAGLPKEFCEMVVHRAAGAWQRAEKQ